MKIKLLFLALGLSLFLASCDKDNDDPVIPPAAPTYPLEGLWTGTYSITQHPATAPLPYTLVFRPGGKVIFAGVGEDGKTYYSDGTWSMVDSVVTANYKTINYSQPYVVTQKSILRYHSNGTMTDGTWEDVDNPAGHLSGEYQNVKRVN